MAPSRIFLSGLAISPFFWCCFCCRFADVCVFACSLFPRLPQRQRRVMSHTFQVSFVANADVVVNSSFSRHAHFLLFFLLLSVFAVLVFPVSCTWVCPITYFALSPLPRLSKHLATVQALRGGPHSSLPYLFPRSLTPTFPSVCVCVALCVSLCAPREVQLSHSSCL